MLVYQHPWARCRHSATSCTMWVAVTYEKWKLLLVLILTTWNLSPDTQDLSSKMIGDRLVNTVFVFHFVQISVIACYITDSVLTLGGVRTPGNVFCSNVIYRRLRRIHTLPTRRFVNSIALHVKEKNTEVREKSWSIMSFSGKFHFLATTWE